MNFQNDYNLDEALRSASYGMIRVSYKVKGFWSRDSITVYIKRSMKWERPEGESATWEAAVTWSTGGRDPKEVECDLEAAGYFAEAIQDAVQFANLLKDTMSDVFEEAYLKSIREYQEAEKRRLEQEAAAAEADPAMTEATAEVIINLALSSGNRVGLFKRGAKSFYAYVEVSKLMRTVYRFNDNVVSRKELRNKLISGQYSNRYAFV